MVSSPSPTRGLRRIVDSFVLNTALVGRDLPHMRTVLPQEQQYTGLFSSRSLSCDIFFTQCVQFIGEGLWVEHMAQLLDNRFV